MLNRVGIGAVTLALAFQVVAAGSVRAQASATVTAVASGPAVKDMAPDFALSGADRYGLLKGPVRLSDFRGRTVVLAFFFQARTKG